MLTGTGWEMTPAASRFTTRGEPSALSRASPARRLMTGSACDGSRVLSRSARGGRGCSGVRLCWAGRTGASFAIRSGDPGARSFARGSLFRLSRARQSQTSGDTRGRRESPWRMDQGQPRASASVSRGCVDHRRRASSSVAACAGHGTVASYARPVFTCPVAIGRPVPVHTVGQASSASCSSCSSPCCPMTNGT